MTITTLVDNTAIEKSPLEAEHGFSCYIQTGNEILVFDTGKSDLFMKNAEILGIDLSTVEHLIISHAHYDHAGGVLPFLTRYAKPTLHMYVGNGFENQKYVSEQGTIRNNGIQFTYSDIEQFQIPLHTITSKTYTIASGVYIVHFGSSSYEEEQKNPKFRVKRQGKEYIDDFEDEISLVIRTGKGLVLITGCSHQGIIYMIDSVQEHFSEPLYGLVGGIHLFDASSARKQFVLRSLLNKNIPMVCSSHCTGDEAEQYLSENCSGYFRNKAGNTITI